MSDKMDEDVNMLPRNDRSESRSKYNFRSRKITQNYKEEEPTKSKKRKAETDLEEEYVNEETDFTLMKETISKNILELIHKRVKLNPLDESKERIRISGSDPLEKTEFSPSLDEIVKTGIDNAFETFNETLVDEIKDLGNDWESESGLDPSWKMGLSKEEIENYKSILKELYNKKSVNIKDILDAPLNNNEKMAALGIYNMLQNTDMDTAEFILIKSKLENMIKNAKNPIYTKEQEDEFEKMENRLKDILSLQKPLKIKILETNLEDSKKAFIYEKFLLYDNLDKDSVTAASLKEWIDHALKVPFNKYSNIFNVDKDAVPEMLSKIKKGLDEELYGMEEVKEQLLCIFNNKLSNPQATGLSIALVGSPGTGKTAIARALQKILKTGFSQISLGGMVDSSLLDGQHPGWVGSAPGMIVKNLQQTGVLDGIFLFDEVDKLGESHHGKEAQYSLLHITDFTQNKEFCDRYIGPELPIDLSKAFYIFALNKLEGLDPALLSRLPIVNVPDYKPNEKVEILKNYVLPSLLKNVGLNKGDVILNDNEALYLIEKSEKIKGKEGGVRGCKDGLVVIVSRINVLLNISIEEQKKLGLNFTRSLTKPVVLDRYLIDNLYKIDNKNDAWKAMYV